MKEPFIFDFPIELLKEARYFDTCPDHYHPKISYAQASHMVLPQLQLLKQLYSGSDIFSALVHATVTQSINVTTLVPQAFVGFFYVMEGETSFQMEGRTEMVCIDQDTCFILYVPAGAYPSPWFPNKNTVAYFVLNQKLVEKMFDDYPELHPPFRKLLQNDPEPGLYQVCKISKAMHLHLRNLGSYAQKRILGTESAILKLFHDLLEEHLQQFSPHKLSPPGRLEIAMRVFEYIRINAFISPLPKMEVIAEKHNIGYRTLLREFKSKFGYTLKDFINHEKMDAAHYLLTKDHLSVKEVSFRLGYGDPQSFSRKFKNHYGYTPGNAASHPTPKTQKVSKNVK